MSDEERGAGATQEGAAAPETRAAHTPHGSGESVEANDAVAEEGGGGEEGAGGNEATPIPLPQSFFSAEHLKSLLDVGSAGGSAGDPRLAERVARIESLFEQSIAEARERERRLEETNRSMRAYFTDELGRLREAVTQELRVRASQKLLQEVLPVLNDMDDLLARADEAAQDEQTARLWRALEAYRRRFYNGLRRLGLEEIKVVEGETLFDPYVHECVSMVEGSPDDADGRGVPPGIIVGVRRRGYLFKDELFQAPQVLIRGGE